jgi:hypothetical protein
LLAALLVIILAGGWLWWNRPQRADMMTYAPAESILYLEANSLPEIVRVLASTDAWKQLAPLVGAVQISDRANWLSQIAARTGLGSADFVVFSRAQVAFVVLDFEITEAGETLKVKPRAAIIAETHTSESRTRAAIERRVGQFARRAYGGPHVERKETDGATYMTWSAPSGGRQITAVVSGSLAIIGNDEETVRVCLAVKRGEHPSFAGNKEAVEMRRHISGDGALAFGYVSPAGTTKLLEVTAMSYAAQTSLEPRAMGLAASLLPRLATKVLGGAGWSARFTAGAIEDRYLLSLSDSVTERLRQAAPAPIPASRGASSLLPSSTYSLTLYNYRDPELAWRSLNSALMTQLDLLSAGFLSAILKESLAPYGIDNPEEFLRAVGPEIATARLDETTEQTVAVVEMRDETTLRRIVAKRLGPNPRSVRIGDAEMLTSSGKDRGAASFVGDRLVLGTVSGVKRCLEARAQNQTLATLDSFDQAARRASAAGPAEVITYASDRTPALTFISAIAPRQAQDQTTLRTALDRLPYSTTLTRVVEGGIERRTRSAFGLFGFFAAQLASEPDSQG